ncbi:hypothetical protein [Psychrobacter sp. 16-MNA-CIBAN-0192]|uniref:hypothetical protein n=1 Tax=Psychrobacter sp. 16-MNA-CIBAN-0192 TaxID=3140448 RepID=UPI00332EA337
MDLRYWPECFHALLAIIYNIVLVFSVSKVVLAIYELSGSLWSLLGFLALLAVARISFTLRVSLSPPNC